MVNAKRLDVPVRACFVAGQMGETKETMQATLDFAVRLDPDTAQFFPMIVYPGTEAYEWAEDNGHLVTKDYSRWLMPDGTHNSVVRTDKLTPEAVNDFVTYATKRFYMRPKVIMRTFWRGLTSYQEAKRIFKAFRRFARYLVK